jgi:hypothetical protein
MLIRIRARREVRLVPREIQLVLGISRLRARLVDWHALAARGTEPNNRRAAA